jgi:DNA repair protein RadC
MKKRIDAWNRHNPQAQIRGVGDGKLLRISAAFLFEKRAKARLAAEDFRKASYNPGNPAGLMRLYARIVAKEPEKEHLFVLPIDAKLHPICTPIDVSQGTITKTPVHPREVFCEATRYRARAVVVAHNHPDGDPTPSGDDFAVTERLSEAGRILGIKLLDHIVLGSTTANGELDFVSIRAIRSELFC